MRTAIFSEKERKMLKHFLETGEKKDGFRVLVYRIRKSRRMIIEDIDLIEKYFMVLAKRYD